MLCDSIYRRPLEESDSQRQEVEWWVPGAVGGWGEGWRWFVFNGDRVSVWEDKKVLGMDGDNGCTTM